MDAGQEQPRAQEHEEPAPGLMETLNSTPSKTVPLREAEVQNAVNFLMHPKVAGSTSGAKRSFLKNKGLTDEEIDEGFSRASKMPTPAPAVPPQNMAPTEHVAPPQAPVNVDQPVPQFTWTKSLLAVSVVVAGAYGVSTMLAPWIKKWWSGDDGGQGDRGEDKRVVALLTAMNKKQEDLDSKVTGVVSTIRSLQAQGSQTDGASSLQTEFAALKSEVKRLNSAYVETSGLSQDINDIKALLQSASKNNSFGSPEVTSKRWPESAGTTPNSLASLTAQRASQPGSIPRSEYTPPVSSSFKNFSAGSSVQENGMLGSTSQQGRAMSESPGPLHPPDYLSILKMLEQGQTPPGVRTDINDKPAFPNVDPTPSEVVRRPKPWERHQPSPQTSPFPLADIENQAPWHSNAPVVAEATAEPNAVSMEDAKLSNGMGMHAADSGVVSKEDVEKLVSDSVTSQDNDANASAKNSGER